MKATIERIAWRWLRVRRFRNVNVLVKSYGATMNGFDRADKVEDTTYPIVFNGNLDRPKNANLGEVTRICRSLGRILKFSGL